MSTNFQQFYRVHTYLGNEYPVNESGKSLINFSSWQTWGMSWRGVGTRGLIRFAPGASSGPDYFVGYPSPESLKQTHIATQTVARLLPSSREKAG
jgi:hypothetical protein